MHFTKLVPNIYYENIQDGLELFRDCLEFQIGFSDLEAQIPCCVLDNGALSVFLFQNREWAIKDRPEIRLHTNNIEEVFKKISQSHPKFLHPNLNKPTLRPWGAREFALRDATNVCVIIQQW